MIRKLGLIGLVLLFSAAWAVPEASAADGEFGGRRSIRASAGEQVTQGELAEILVNVLGLSRFLPAAPTPYEYEVILAENNVMPADGWQSTAVVTRAVLARVIVQAMQMQNEVDNPDDPRAWIMVLQSLGVSIDTIGEAVDGLEPLPEPVAPNVFVVSATTDPLKKRDKFGEPDEKEFGTDVEYIPSIRPYNRPVTIEEVVHVVREVSKKKKKREPATPD